MKPIIPPHRVADFQARLLRWFRHHKRDMPWRRSRDPYRVWVAEVMLQQTRIAAVIPYYRKFLRRFPSAQALAKESEPEVLQYWSGLGYYNRARNLHRAAREIIANHAGKFPQDYDAALALPGIGRYTAAAVLSIAYDLPLAVLDGNVARVLARLGAVRGGLRQPRRWKALENAAERLLASRAPGDWNQALMELGEVVCTPRTPRCNTCPVVDFCVARKHGIAEKIPSPRRKPAPVQMAIAAAVLRDPNGRTLLVQEPGAHDDVLFSRMWQFPAVEVKTDARGELSRRLQETLELQAPLLEELPAARHGVTFRNVILLPFLAEVDSLPAVPRSCTLPLENIDTVPISSATRKIAAAALGR